METELCTWELWFRIPESLRLWLLIKNRQRNPDRPRIGPVGRHILYQAMLCEKQEDRS